MTVISNGLWPKLKYLALLAIHGEENVESSINVPAKVAQGGRETSIMVPLSAEIAPPAGVKPEPQQH